MIPYGMAVLPLKKFIVFAKLEKENNRYKIEFQEFYSRELWHNTISAIQKVYQDLPEPDKNNSVIWAKHYKQAGAINLYQQKYHIPPAISYRGSYYTWSPEKGILPGTVIAISNQGVGIDFWHEYFNSVTPKKKIYDRYANDDEDEWQTIYLCKEPKQNFSELKRLFKDRIFE
jgi:hypothetical protein